MSQMPDKIWLHKDTKYSTGDTVCGYQYDFVQGIEDEGGIENFVKYVPADALIDKACEWLRNNMYEGTCEQMLIKKPYPFMSNFIDEFKQAMKGE